MDNLSQDIEQILDKVWGAGLDFGSSDDFSTLIDNERDKAYLTYKGNIEAEATSALTQLFNKRLEALGAEIIGEDIECDGTCDDGVHDGQNALKAEQRKRLAQLKEAQQ